jgi:death-on-curing protein
VFSEDAYPTLADKAAALLHGIARNHALVDGNKRLAWAAARVFLLMNGYSINYTIDDAEATVVGVARGDVDVAELSTWLRSRMAMVG